MSSFVPRRLASVILGGGADDDIEGVSIYGLRIDFEVIKYDGAAPDIATIRIFNLSSERRSLARERYRRVILEFGYSTDTVSVLFVGEVFNIIDSRENGTDIVTTLYCGSGVNVLENGYAHQRFPIGAAMRDMVEAVGKAAEDFGVQFGGIIEDINEDNPGAVRGRVVSGSIDAVLRDLLEGTGFRYSINDDVLTIEQPTVADTSDVIIGPNTGLIGSIRETNAGFDMSCVCNPAIRVGQTIGVFSDFAETNRDGLNYTAYENARGAFVRVMQLTHKGGNYTGGATTDVTGLRKK